MSKAAEHKWAGELSAYGFILENIIAVTMVNQGPDAARALGDELLRQWNGSPIQSAAKSPFDAALIHQAGAARIASLFAAVAERLE